MWNGVSGTPNVELWRSSFPADTEWNEETNREREEEKDPERATQGVEH